MRSPAAALQPALFFMNHPTPTSTQKTLVSGLRGSAPAWFCATTKTDQPACCIVADEQMSAGFEQDLALFTSRPILSYPGYEIPPYTPFPLISTLRLRGFPRSIS